MDKIYLIGCIIIALLLPHLTDESVRVGYQILLQAAFVLIGITGARTFSD